MKKAILTIGIILMAFQVGKAQDVTTSKTANVGINGEVKGHSVS